MRKLENEKRARSDGEPRRETIKEGDGGGGGRKEHGGE